jgi:hypothetical protein
VTHLTTAAGAARRRTRRALAALLAVTGLLVLAGCMKIEMNMTLTEDDSVSGTIVMAISNEVAESMGMDAGELWDQAGGEMGAELPDGASQEPYADDEYTGTTFTFEDQPIEEFSGADEELSIAREGDEYVVSGVMDLSEGAEGMEGSQEMPQEILDTFLVTIAVTFPGDVTETNGTVDGTTVTWNPAFGETTEMSARGSAVAGGGAAGGGTEPGTEASEGSGAGTDTGSTDAQDVAATDDAGFPWWIVGLVAGLAVIGLVVTLIVRNNRRPEPAAAPQGDVFGSLPGQQAPGHGSQPGQTPPAPGQNPPSVQPGQPPVDPYDTNPR